MVRVRGALVALALFAMPPGLFAQDNPPAPSGALDAKVIAVGDACPLTITGLKTEQTDAGWTLHLTLKNPTENSLSEAEVLLYTLTREGRLRRVDRQFVNTDDLPVPAHDTKDTTVPAFAAQEGEHIRVAAIVPGTDGCDAVGIRRAVLDEFEPPELVVVTADGTPFRISGVQITKTAGGVPSRVDYTIQVDASQPSTDTAKVAVVAFAYSDRGLALRVKAFDESKSVLPPRASAGSVNLRLPQLPPGAKWKLAVMVDSGVFTKEDGETAQWSAGKSAEENAIALAALYSAHR